MHLEFTLKAIVQSYDNPEQYNVYLFNEVEKLLLPISTNRWSAESIILAKQQAETPRPHIHNTFMRLLRTLDAHLVSVSVYHLFEDVYYAYLNLFTHKGNIDLDIKVTDALCLCLLHKVPFMVADKVYDSAGIKVTRELLERSLSI